MTNDGTKWPLPVIPGPETRALRRFHRDVVWTGRIEATPLSPAMTAEGRGQFRWSGCGLWVLGSFRQDQFADGRKVTEWWAEYIAGWDTARGTYVAFAADSNGRSVPFTGVMDADRFIITSDAPALGGEVVLRMIWDAADPDAILWRNEMSVSGGPWMLVESYLMTPV